MTKNKFIVLIYNLLIISNLTYGIVSIDPKNENALKKAAYEINEHQNVGIVKKVDKKPICNGIILGPLPIAITAAHCVRDLNLENPDLEFLLPKQSVSSEKSTYDSFLIFLISLLKTNITKENIKLINKYKVKKIIVSDELKLGNKTLSQKEVTKEFNNIQKEIKQDIAILILEDVDDFQDFPIIKLDFSEIDFNEEKCGTMLGRGSSLRTHDPDKKKDDAKTLKAAIVCIQRKDSGTSSKILPPQVTPEAVKNYYNDNEKYNHLAGSASFGDGGGPLFIKDDFLGNNILVGTISYAHDLTPNPVTFFSLIQDNLELILNAIIEESSPEFMYLFFVSQNIPLENILGILKNENTKNTLINTLNTMGYLWHNEFLYHHTTNMGNFTN